MAGIKVRIDQPEPGTEVIRKYKNFDSLMDNYKKYYTSRGIRDMLYKDRRKIVYLVIILIFLLLLLFFDDAEAVTLLSLL